MYQQQHIEFIIQKAKKRLDLQEAPGCTKAGWLMITALLIESWDIYSMAFILFALKDIYEPSSWLLGLPPPAPAWRGGQRAARRLADR
jgi:hypothetical protein